MVSGNGGNAGNAGAFYDLTVRGGGRSGASHEGNGSTGTRGCGCRLRVRTGWKTDIEGQHQNGNYSLMRILPVLLLLSACQHSDAGAGPNRDALGTAIVSNPAVTGPVRFSTSDLRSLVCRAFDEEPTEFLCHFQAREPTGVWRKRSAIMAMQRGGWVLLSLD